jgi:hypothetical protein
LSISTATCPISSKFIITIFHLLYFLHFSMQIQISNFFTIPLFCTLYCCLCSLYLFIFFLFSLTFCLFFSSAYFYFSAYLSFNIVSFLFPGCNYKYDYYVLQIYSSSSLIHQRYYLHNLFFYYWYDLVQYWFFFLSNECSYLCNYMMRKQN